MATSPSLRPRLRVVDDAQSHETRLVERARGGDMQAWSRVYRVMAVLMLVGVVTTLLSPEPEAKDVDRKQVRTTADYLRFLATFAVAAAFVKELRTLLLT